MNYLLAITSQPEFVVKFKKENPPVDNALDLGNFIKPALVTQPLTYLDAKNGNISFDTLISYDALTAVSGGILISKSMKALIESNFPHEVQFLDAVIDFKGQSTDRFVVMNVYTKIPCYDLEKSVYEVNPVDNSYEFEKIIPVNGPLEEYDVEYNIVRSAHDNKIVVSEQFKQLMEANHINSLSYEKEFVIEW